MILVCLFGVSEYSREALACSAVSGERLWGANYDWQPQEGIAFQSPGRQMKRAFMAGPRAVAWVSRFSSITISQFGRDFPMQGMNERGLAGVVLMGKAEYPPSGKIGNVTENLWLQYQLDHYASVAEVAEHIDDLGIQRLSAPLHWFLCDASGACGVFEFVNGKPRVRYGRDLEMAVLTNNPYADSLARWNAWRVSGSELPEGYESFARFIRLVEASLFPGFGRDAESVTAALVNVSHRVKTAWQTVFDSREVFLSVRAGTGARPEQVWRRLDARKDAVPDCGEPLMMLPLAGTSEWKPYDHDAVRALFERAARGTTGLGGEAMDAILRETETVNCDFPDKIR